MSASQVDQRTGIALLPEFKLGSRALGAADAVMAMIARWIRNRAAERRLSELSDKPASRRWDRPRRDRQRRMARTRLTMPTLVFCLFPSSLG